jgi:predicted HAD superfamily Cof-like phosphohydrolase
MEIENFSASIERFNQIYKLPCAEKPQFLGLNRLKDFVSILSEEVAEGTELLEKYSALSPQPQPATNGQNHNEFLTELSDWLGDVVVYCFSEAKRWGIPMEKVLGAIMDSNFSKLDAEGKPIYDERGKVMKGPEYFKPEPKIAEILALSMKSEG